MRVSTIFRLLGVISATRQVCAFVAPRQSMARPSAAASSPRTISKLDVVGPEIVTDAITGVAVAAEYPVSPEPIHTAFKVATFYGQIFFLLMIIFPKSTVTKKIMGGLGKQHTENSRPKHFVL